PPHVCLQNGPAEAISFFSHGASVTLLGIRTTHSTHEGFAMRHSLILNALFASLLLLPAVLRAEDSPKEFPLWPNGAPGFEDRKDEKEVHNQKPGDEYTVTNVHSPTLTAYLPSKDKATGAAMVIVPGGGHREIWIV